MEDKDSFKGFEGWAEKVKQDARAGNPFKQNLKSRYKFQWKLFFSRKFFEFLRSLKCALKATIGDEIEFAFYADTTSKPIDENQAD